MKCGHWFLSKLFKPTNMAFYCWRTKTCRLANDVPSHSVKKKKKLREIPEAPTGSAGVDLRFYTFIAMLYCSNFVPEVPSSSWCSSGLCSKLWSNALNYARTAYFPSGYSQNGPSVLRYIIWAIPVVVKPRTINKLQHGQKEVMNVTTENSIKTKHGLSFIPKAQAYSVGRYSD